MREQRLQELSGDVRAQQNRGDPDRQPRPAAQQRHGYRNRREAHERLRIAEPSDEAGKTAHVRVVPDVSKPPEHRLVGMLEETDVEARKPGGEQRQQTGAGEELVWTGAPGHLSEATNEDGSAIRSGRLARAVGAAE